MPTSAIPLSRAYCLMGLHHLSGDLEGVCTSVSFLWFVSLSTKSVRIIRDSECEPMLSNLNTIKEAHTYQRDEKSPLSLYGIKERTFPILLIIGTLLFKIHLSSLLDFCTPCWFTMPICVAPPE
ncbi:unnamed protein product [Lepeophtheirus salmonis]|uniref:(salmon louse) hypothetical protein n=1 Tax=Lepeophtheirus salmonis TaxID=72036 RepID=A0A7R8H1P1_LEPSM|nr:unnamed protein product [Lepeophtheirus salmonis]CAF2813058.1 unnamed protein product [Lepeophtheirus salmonis]